MADFNTIHVFGFGDVQLISKDKNTVVKANTLTKLTAFVNHVKTFKPVDVVEAEYHVIHVFANNQVKYLGLTDNFKTKASFSVAVSELNQTILNDFVNEVVATAE